ncbi:LegC family aminotransferase [Methanocorpusculum bavaricum]|uniref:LegC family aminotransferase n=1 Tax=Methanocorpusculum bavaricum TaxID=71518 RepID=UPI0005B2E6A4|nr:LegC family aminotransferase [Methanocorpusculum bavaricum]
MSKFIPLSVPNLKGNEKKYVDDAITQEWVSTGGAYINRMEKMVADYVHTPDAVACQSGTAALHLSLICCGVQNGDEVIVPTLTFVAAVNPVRYMNADPVFMDCDDTLCMDMDKLERFCVEECEMQDGKLIDKVNGKHISAVIVVHVFGNIANMEKLMELKTRYGFKVIEDATEAMGSFINSGIFAGKFAGTIGDMGALSFNGNKIITTGGGGMLISEDIGLLEKARYLSTQAKDDVVYFKHNEIGYNYRMTNLQAAVGVAQLEQLEDFISTKHANYITYIENDVPLYPFRADTRANYWFYSYLTEKRDELITYLGENNVQSRPIWHLIHALPPYINSRNYCIEKAQYFWEHVVNIPCSTNLSKDDVIHVSKLIHDFDHKEGK